ncbi:Protein EMSY-LIKE 3 [Abeliophyllum distichum]|uniref:Protein EMSY-LIKE 3 n=1 Tax=Abeliophyllum distichum TaxID=126358 RepID=A0ABD1ULR4_9LAMI
MHWFKIFLSSAMYRVLVEAGRPETTITSRVLPTLPFPIMRQLFFSKFNASIRIESCEAFSTYPRTYDLLHIDGHFTAESHSACTDDDHPQPQYNRVPLGGRVAGNGRSFVGSAPYQRMQSYMESEIHNLEQIAYAAVQRAFKAQSDALTWEKEGLITKLRKELRVSDDKHRDLLTKVNADDLIRRIREWREAGGIRNAAFNVPLHVNDQLPSPTVSASRKKQKTSLSGNPFGTPSAICLQ